MSELIDSTGIHGAAFDYGVIFFLMGSAFVFFCYLASKGKLGFDEEAKYHLFQSDSEQDNDG